MPPLIISAGPKVRRIIALEAQAARLDRRHITPLRRRLAPWLAKRDAIWKDVGELERQLTPAQLAQLRRARMTRREPPL